MSKSSDLRDVSQVDLPLVLELNQSELPHVSSITLDELNHLHQQSVYHRVVLLDGRVAGFLLCLDPSADYASMNYQWFLKRYPSFVYIDRIVVAKWAQNRGLGQILYRDIEAFTKARAPILACEVNIKPYNEVSIRFHQAFGFHEVGQQDTEGGKKRVSMMVKEV